MMKFVVLSMVVAIAMASPAGGSYGSPSMEGIKKDKCFAPLLNLKDLTLSNIIELVGCLLQEILRLVQNLLGGEHASALGKSLIQVLSNLIKLLINLLKSIVQVLVDGKGDKEKGISTILEGVFKIVPELKKIL